MGDAKAFARELVYMALMIIVWMIPAMLKRWWLDIRDWAARKRQEVSRDDTD